MTANPLTEKIDRLRAGADEIREAMAAQIFSLKAVTEAMARATAQGFRAVKISPPVHVDLSATKAGQEIFQQLKGAGAGVEWVPRPPTDASVDERMMELVVRW